MKGERQVWSCDGCGKPVTIYWDDEYMDSPALVLCAKCNHGHKVAGY